MIQVDKIEQTYRAIAYLFEMYGDNPDDYDSLALAKESYRLSNGLCTKCGVHLEIYKEVYGVNHEC